MSDTPDLASLTIKDLRLMAGTHSIHNASRMGKEKLIGVLAGVLASRATAAADEVAPEAPRLVSNDGAAAALAPLPVITEPSAPVLVDSTPANSPAAGNDEPEELDAASVAAFADVAPLAPALVGTGAGTEAGEGAADEGAPGEGEPRRRRRRRRRGRGRGGERDDSGEQGNPAGEGADEAGDEAGDEGSDETGSEAARNTAPNASRETASNTPKSAAASDTAASAALANETANSEAPGAPIAPTAQTPFGARLARRPENPNATVQPPAGDRRASGDRQQSRERQSPADRQSSGDRQAPADRQPAGERQDRDQRQSAERPALPVGDRAPRPRLEGAQRPVSSVLDRLSVFTRGILELCDPSTPSWAQPRLAELLAEAGVVPMPAAGAPHGDYHRILGTVATTNAPAGHICEITAQGFALRGDRGDLFCLRKADVRIAGARTEDGAPKTAAVVRAPFAAPDARRAASPTSAPQQPVPGEQPVASEQLVPTEQPVASEQSVSAEQQIDMATSQLDVAQVTDAPNGVTDGGLPPSVYQERPRRERGRRGDRGDRREAAEITGEARQPTSDNAPAQGEPEVLGETPTGEPAPSNETASVNEAAAAPAPVRVPVPSPGRSPERLHPRESATVAQPLPLTHLATEELAAKPKAEAFRKLGLNDQILADLAAMGWNEPSPIQAAAIPVALSGKDLIGQAQTGTGKTAGFVLPTLQKLYALEGDGTVALMMCPTRELAKQVYNEFIKMAGTSAARAALIYGGVDMNDQYRALERKPHVVIGTPGRVIDHMKRKTLDLSRLATIVLDEADQMLDIGFWPDVTYIMSHTPPQRQVLLFSATFPEQVKELAEKHMKDPERIQIAPEQVTVSNVDQKYIAVPRERKNELLARFIETFNPPQLVVFCKTKHQTDRVAEVLKRKNMSAGAIHGDLPQSKREKTLQAFRSGELQSLVATNVAARGLDIPSVSHVVNYDVPETPEEYVHRIGRTARNGASGVARTFITSEDGQFLLEIEKHIGLLLEEEQVEGFTVAVPLPSSTRTIADAPVGTPRLLKPLIGGIRLGRRR